MTQTSAIPDTHLFPLLADSNSYSKIKQRIVTSVRQILEKACKPFSAKVNSTGLGPEGTAISHDSAQAV